MGIGEVIVSIFGIMAAAGTACCYLVMRADVLKRQGGRGDSGTQQAIEALRAEIAALRRQESEAVLSFDSTLQVLDARLRHLEKSALPDGERARDGEAVMGYGVERRGNRM